MAEYPEGQAYRLTRDAGHTVEATAVLATTVPDGEADVVDILLANIESDAKQWANSWLKYVVYGAGLLTILVVYKQLKPIWTSKKK